MELQGIDKKTLLYYIRRHERNKANKIGRSERFNGTWTQLTKEGNVLMTRTLTQVRERTEHDQKEHGRKAGKIEAIEAMNRSANKPSNQIKVHIRSKETAKQLIQAKYERRKQAILKHKIDILLNN